MGRVNNKRKRAALTRSHSQQAQPVLRSHSVDSNNSSVDDCSDKNTSDDDRFAALLSDNVQLRETINKLQAKVDYLLSYLGITDSNPNSSDTGTLPENRTFATVTKPVSHPVTDIDIDKACNLKTSKQAQPNICQKVLSAVYQDLHTREARAKNVVVCGLISEIGTDDKTSFLQFCQQEFRSKPSVSYSRRLGKPVPGRINPLLVVLSCKYDAESLIRMDRNRAYSGREGVYKDVFVNPDLTKAESEAAYNERQKRRQRILSKNQPVPKNGKNNITTTVGNTSEEHVIAAQATSNGADLHPSSSSTHSASEMEIGIDGNVSTLNPMANTFAPENAISDGRLAN